MTVLFALAMIVLALAPLLAAWRARASALAGALGGVALLVVGLVAALDGPRPVLELGSWLGFGASALNADGLAGIFLALTGVTAATVSLAYVETPPGRGLAALHGVIVLAVAVAMGADNAFLFFLPGRDWRWPSTSPPAPTATGRERSSPGISPAG